jgi:hypothetical protein
MIDDLHDFARTRLGTRPISVSSQDLSPLRRNAPDEVPASCHCVACQLRREGARCSIIRNRPCSGAPFR